MGPRVHTQKQEVLPGMSQENPSTWECALPAAGPFPRLMWFAWEGNWVRLSLATSASILEALLLLSGCSQSRSFLRKEQFQQALHSHLLLNRILNTGESACLLFCVA